jgi:hypothetical protein
VIFMFSRIGVILLVSALVILAFQGMSAFLGMGSSDEFVYKNVSFADILHEGFVGWVDDISSPSIKSFAETLINAPIALWMVGGALFCFVIHAFRGPKHIR